MRVYEIIHVGFWIMIPYISRKWPLAIALFATTKIDCGGLGSDFWSPNYDNFI